MAIVFDTQAELEAFCEAFELRTELQTTVKRSRKRFPESEDRVDEQQTAISLVENPPSVEEDSSLVGVTPLEISPMPEPFEELSIILASAS